MSLSYQTDLQIAFCVYLLGNSYLQDADVTQIDADANHVDDVWRSGWEWTIHRHHLLIRERYDIFAVSPWI